MSFLVSHENQENAEGYNFELKRMFSGIKSDFSRILIDSRGKYRITMTRSLLERIFL